MSNTLKTLLAGSVAAVAFAGAAQAQLDVELSGRIDFTLEQSDSINGNDAAIVGGVLVPGSDINIDYDNDTLASSDDIAWGTGGRLDVAVSGSTCCFDYGGLLRVVDGTSAGTTRNIYISSSRLGRLDFGNDVSGLQGALDADVIGTGVHSTSNTVRTPLVSHDFSGSAVDNARIAYTSPSFGGATVSAAVDGNNDWNASVAYSGTTPGFGALPSLGFDAAVGATSSNAFGGKVTTSIRGIGIGAAYGQDDDGESYITGGVKYSFAGVDFSVAAGMQSAENEPGSVVLATVPPLTNITRMVAEQTEILAGATYTLAPGLSVTGTFGMFERTTDMDADTAGGEVSIDGTIAAARLRLSF